MPILRDVFPHPWMSPPGCNIKMTSKEHLTRSWKASIVVDTLAKSLFYPEFLYKGVEREVARLWSLYSE
jgi:hypothetical protein